MHDLIARALLFISLIVLMEWNSISANPDPFGCNLFARNLLPLVANNKFNNNIIYSPSSIYNFLISTYLYSNGNAAEEIRLSLKLGKRSEIDPTLKYKYSLLGSLLNETKTNNIESEPVIYSFYGSGNNLTREVINEIGEREMLNKTQNLIVRNVMSYMGSATLKNYIRFKGDWLSSKYATSYSPGNPNEPFLMYEHCKYAELHDINAEVFEMPYKNTDITMMIIYPNENQTLRTLVNRLKYIDLNDISSKMESADIGTFIPNLHLKYEMDLSITLRKMGISLIFEENASIKHKAVLKHDVNGSVAAASTEFDTYDTTYSEELDVTHPCVFFIRSKSVVYFAGHIVKLP